MIQLTQLSDFDDETLFSRQSTDRTTWLGCLYRFYHCHFDLLIFIAMATFIALQRTYLYLTPDLWSAKNGTVNPYAEFSDFLEKTSKRR